MYAPRQFMVSDPTDDRGRRRKLLPHTHRDSALGWSGQHRSLCIAYMGYHVGIPDVVKVTRLYPLRPPYVSALETTNPGRFRAMQEM